MKIYKVFYVFFLSLFFISGCGLNAQGTTPHVARPIQQVTGNAEANLTQENQKIPPQQIHLIPGGQKHEGFENEPIQQGDLYVPLRDSENIDHNRPSRRMTNQQGVQFHGQANETVRLLEKRIVPPGKKPKNVIVLIGDGLGMGQMEVARLFEHGKEGRLFMQSLPHVALSQTYSADNFVTDSAAAGTALATAKKTNNTMLGITPDGTELDSILDASLLAGKKVGFVSTNTATDATPAAFYASVRTRAGQDEIARQLFAKDIDVILGGGKEFFTPERQNGVNLIEKFQDKGYTYVTDRNELNAATGEKLLGLFNDSFMNYKIDRDELNSKEPTLTEMTEKTLEFLNRGTKGNKGFFAMIEGARIDHAAHAADFASIWQETIEFDNAVEYAVNWAKKDGNTLVVALSDHETMGIAAAEPMNINKLKGIPVTPEYMVNELVFDNGANRFTTESIKGIFSKYADIQLTDSQVEQFNQRILDNQGRRVPTFRIGWEIGTIIADHYQGGAMNSKIRSLSGTGGHSGNMVPIFAYGVGAEVFNGVFDNTEVPKVIAQLTGVNLEDTAPKGKPRKTR
ncbi:MAG: alkaline phosphatase [Anaerobacillus sp.]|uniref:alkaline phosphatase n=1 Tax=Anaerobacillus sp. TaxID=1872506 RepID=UPI00391C5197